MPSILFERPEDQTRAETAKAPECFGDLNLDQIVAEITAGKDAYNLKPFLYAPLRDIDALEYRHQVFRDLEDKTLLEHIKSFAQKMRRVREQLEQADKLSYQYQKERWFLDAVETYCDAAQQLAQDLTRFDLRARGLLAFREYLTSYLQAEPFSSLVAETKQLQIDLSTIRYCFRIKDNSIKVRKYEGEADYSAEVTATFEKFRQGAVRDYRAKLPNWPEMNHVEARVLDFVAQLHPDIFERLDDFCARHMNFIDETLCTFDREIQFYVAYLDYMAIFQHAHLRFCYPRLSTTDKRISNDAGFDLALAYKLRLQNASIVCNDFYLRDPERILVVTGPNQGGKTTFARVFGQLHYLASLGCPVPGRQAQLFLFDQLLTHFEREEDIENLRGKLEDDLFRVHAILAQATSSSIIILNEIFTSTTLSDAVFLSKEVLERIIALDLVCVCVTFIDELTSFSKKTVSMVSMVVPENPTHRTFKIVRRRADGLAYAISIAEKYRLTYAILKERLNV